MTRIKHKFWVYLYHNDRGVVSLTSMSKLGPLSKFAARDLAYVATKNKANHLEATVIEVRRGRPAESTFFAPNGNTSSRVIKWDVEGELERYAHETVPQNRW